MFGKVMFSVDGNKVGLLSGRIINQSGTFCELDLGNWGYHKFFNGDVLLVSDKNNLYKTAYSPKYGKFVEILEVWKQNHVYSFRCRIGDSDCKVTFKQDELKDFCL